MENIFYSFCTDSKLTEFTRVSVVQKQNIEWDGSLIKIIMGCVYKMYI